MLDTMATTVISQDYLLINIPSLVNDHVSILLSAFSSSMLELSCELGCCIILYFFLSTTLTGKLVSYFYLK